MTAKEKAEDLIKKFRDESFNFESETMSAAISNSITCVDEICKEFYPVRYWDQVKSELEKLKSEFA